MPANFREAGLHEMPFGRTAAFDLSAQASQKERSPRCRSNGLDCEWISGSRL